MNQSRELSLRESSLILIALTVAVHGAFVAWKGFYMDDWRFIQLWESAPNQGLPALMKAFNVGNFCWYRPCDIPYFSIQYWLFGRAGWLYQALQLFFNAAAVVLLHAAWRRASGQAALSFLAAVIFAVYPNHAATHHWLSAPFAAVACLFAGALLFQLAAAQSGRWLHALSASVLFAAAILTYEAVLPLAVLIPALCAMRLRLNGRTAKKAWLVAACSVIPLVLAAVAAVLYQQVLIPRLFPTGQTRPMSFNFVRLLQMYGRSFECSTSGVLALAADSGRRAVEAGLWLLLPALAAAVAGGYWLWRRGVVEAADAQGGGQEWLIGGAAAWVASYAPVAVSAQGYVPHIFDEQNRLNAAGTVGGSMLAASALMFLARTRRKTAAACFVVFFTLSAGVDWVAGWDWMRSWLLQTHVLTEIARQAPSGPADIALSGVPETIGRAAVFHADWEFETALQVWTRRPDLSGRLRPGAQPAGKPAFIYQYPQSVIAPTPK
jgi:hypothetical protein